MKYILILKDEIIDFVNLTLANNEDCKFIKTQSSVGTEKFPLLPTENNYLIVDDSVNSISPNFFFSLKQEHSEKFFVREDVGVAVDWLGNIYTPVV